MQIGHRLRQIRERHGVSQGRLARLIGVSVGSIQNYEHGRVAITIDRIEQLALALRCKPAELLAEPGSHPSEKGKGANSRVSPIRGDTSRRCHSRG